MPSDPTATGSLIASLVITARGSLPRRGDALGTTGAVSDGALAWEQGTLTYVGPREELPTDDALRLDGVTVVPGFVDCHTHLPFPGWRADEFEARFAGRSYRDLHGEGGIYRSARMFAESTDEQVLAFCRPLLQEMADHGTTTLELKSGYGLSVPAELRQLRLARRLAEEAPQTCSVTLLACHAVPQGTARDDWVRMACDELIPAAASEGLADAVDVYVEDIAFSVADLEAVARAAEGSGVPLRCHAEQLGHSGAAEAAVRLGARSADHLNHVGPEGVAALAAGETVAVLLPASTLLLRATPPDVRSLIGAGAAVALATDFNPGTAPVLSMPEAIGLGCSLYGLSPDEALIASTANPAQVLGLGEELGTLEPGKRADFVVLDGVGFGHVPYRPGHNPVVDTYIGGHRVGGR